RRRGGVEAVLMNVAHNPDNFCPRPVVAACTQLNPFAKGILARKDLPCGHFADDGDWVRSRSVSLGKYSAPEQRDPHGAEIVRAHDIAIHGRNFWIGNTVILNDKSSLIQSAKTSG